MIRLFNDNLGRALHAALFARLHSFCIKHTPELPAEVAVNVWLSRLYTGDPNLHILVELDDKYNIIEHALIDVSSFLDLRIVECRQAQHDKPSISHAVELMEYLDKLREHENASCIIFSIADGKHAKTFEKRHNYKILRTVLIKTPDLESEENSDG